MKRIFTQTITTLFLLAIAPLAMAQENPRADVQPLYEEALRAMGAKDYQTACQKFSEVTQKYPEGIGAWLELGRCEQARGRIARAYEVFLAAEVAAKNQGQTERSLRAANAAKALEPRLSFWTISVPAEIRKLPGLEAHGSITGIAGNQGTSTHCGMRFNVDNQGYGMQDWGDVVVGCNPVSTGIWWCPWSMIRSLPISAGSHTIRLQQTGWPGNTAGCKSEVLERSAARLRIFVH